MPEGRLYRTRAGYSGQSIDRLAYAVIFQFPDGTTHTKGDDFSPAELARACQQWHRSGYTVTLRPLGRA